MPPPADSLTAPLQSVSDADQEPQEPIESWDVDAAVARVLGWKDVALVPSVVDGYSGCKAAVGYAPEDKNQKRIKLRTPRYGTDMEAATQALIVVATQVGEPCQFGMDWMPEEDGTPVPYFFARIGDIGHMRPPKDATADLQPLCAMICLTILARAGLVLAKDSPLEDEQTEPPEPDQENGADDQDDQNQDGDPMPSRIVVPSLLLTNEAQA